MTWVEWLPTIGMPRRRPLPEVRLIERAVAQDPRAVREFLELIAPVIRMRVGRVMLARGIRSRNVREEVMDLTQDVLATLFKEDARVLRAWDPARGLSLKNYVGMVAERHAHTVMSSRVRNPWFEEPVDEHPRPGSSRGHEEAVAAKDLWAHAARRVEVGLSETGRAIFRLMYIEGMSNREISDQLGMSLSAVQQWRTRTRRALREEITSLMTVRGLEGRP